MNNLIEDILATVDSGYMPLLKEYKTPYDMLRKLKARFAPTSVSYE